MTSTVAIARPAVPTARPAVPTARVAVGAAAKATSPGRVTTSDAYRSAPKDGPNLAQPIGMGIFAVGAFGALAARGTALYALMGLAFAGLALAGTGVKVKLPDGSTGAAGLKGAGVLAPGAGLMLGAGAVALLGITGWAAVGVIAAPCVLGIVLSQALLK